MQERRRFARIPEQTEIAYRILPDTKTLRFITRNVSEGGIGFFSREFIPNNSLLEIRITLNKIPYSFIALVKSKWITEKPYNYMYDTGAEFADIPREASRRVKEYIKDTLENKQ